MVYSQAVDDDVTVKCARVSAVLQIPHLYLGRLDVGGPNTILPHLQPSDVATVCVCVCVWEVGGKDLFKFGSQHEYQVVYAKPPLHRNFHTNHVSVRASVKRASVKIYYTD